MKDVASSPTRLSRISKLVKELHVSDSSPKKTTGVPAMWAFFRQFGTLMTKQWLLALRNFKVS